LRHRSLAIHYASVLSIAADCGNENVHGINKLQEKVSALAFDKLVSILTKSIFTQIARSHVHIIHIFLMCQATPTSLGKLLICIMIVEQFQWENLLHGSYTKDQQETRKCCENIN
jgi:hypothetical protein